MQHRFKAFLPSILVAAMAAPLQLVCAQGVLEEVTVVAQRRSENLQDVPIAVSALSAATIERADIHDLTDIATRAPNLTFSPFSPGQNIVALRGVSSTDDGAGTDNSVALFVDDVYMGRVSNINPEMFDIQHVEVLRGPQGTLYGKNTIGGAINVFSTRPDMERLSAKVRGNFGNYDRTDVAGLVTGPVSDRLAGKFSFSYRDRDGWVDNVVLDKKQKDDNSQAYRAQLLYSGNSTEFLLSGDYQRLDVEDMARIPLTQIAGNLGPIVDLHQALCGTRTPKCSTNPSDGFAETESWGVSLHITHEFALGEIKSITAYRENQADWEMDSVGVAIPLTDDILDKTKQVTQELRWLGGTDSLRFVIGLWYLNERTDRFEVFDIGSNKDVSASDRYRQDNETNNAAGFGQVDWELNDKLRLSLGGRLNHETKEIQNDAVDGDFVVIAQTFSNSRESTWTSFTPKIALSYEPWDDVNTYFSIAKGFKSGGFGAAPQRIEDTEPLDQETAINYEVGLKADLLENLRVNTAIFYTKYEGLQIQVFGPLAGCIEDPATPQIECFGAFQTFNAGNAEAKGIELEFTWAPLRNLTLSGFYSYMDSKFTDATIPASAFPFQTGQDLLRAPRNKYALSGEYVIPLPESLGGEVVTGMSYRFTDDQRGELEPWAVQPSFDLLDARFAWVSAGGGIEIAVWGKNLLDEEYVTHLYTIAGDAVGVFGEPRMYGVSLTWRYD